MQKESNDGTVWFQKKNSLFTVISQIHCSTLFNHTREYKKSENHVTQNLQIENILLLLKCGLTIFLS